MMIGVALNVGPLFFSFVASLNDDVCALCTDKNTNHSCVLLGMENKMNVYYVGSINIPYIGYDPGRFFR